MSRNTGKKRNTRVEKNADDSVRRRCNFIFFLLFSTVRSDSQYSEPGPISHVLDGGGGGGSSVRDEHVFRSSLTHSHTHTRTRAHTYSYIILTVIYYVHVYLDVGYVVRAALARVGRRSRAHAWDLCRGQRTYIGRNYVFIS